MRAGERKESCMFRAVGLSMICLAMFSIAGGHWAVLQSVAWAQMLRDYSKEATVAEAVEKTFSGDAPCSMCKKISEAQKKEQKAPATVKVDKKAEVFVIGAYDFLKQRIARDYSYRTPADATIALRTDAPPVPVPIARA